MKKFIATILTLALFIGLMAPASAVVQEPINNALLTTNITVEGESTEIRYRKENGYLVYVEIGDDVVEKARNIVYLNGVEIATITTTSNLDSGIIEPRTSWIYGDGTCPYGSSPSDYNKLYDTRTHNITFKRAIAKCTRDILLSTLVLIVPFINVVTGREVFSVVASAILNNILNYEGDTLYATEYIYSGGIPYTHKNVFDFYGDLSQVNFAETATCYSSWA